MYTYIYVHTHTRIYICIYMYIHLYIYIGVQHMHVADTEQTPRMKALLPTSIHIQSYTHTHTYPHTNTHSQTNTHTHTRTHTHTYTHTHTGGRNIHVSDAEQTPRTTALHFSSIPWPLFGEPYRSRATRYVSLLQRRHRQNQGPSRSSDVPGRAAVAEHSGCVRAETAVQAAQYNQHPLCCSTQRLRPFEY